MCVLIPIGFLLVLLHCSVCWRAGAGGIVFPWPGLVCRVLVPVRGAVRLNVPEDAPIRPKHVEKDISVPRIV
jgi:hypothetical protein